MANRLLEQFRLSFEKQVVELFCNIAIGAAGAPTITRAKGVKSVVRNSAGKYTITLQDSYYRLEDVTIQGKAGTSPEAAPIHNLVSEAVSNSTPTVVIQCYAIDNSTATDPASGESLLIRIACGNSSI